jgi:hypothetical protein
MMRRLKLLNLAMAALLTPVGLGVAPIPIEAMAQQSQLPPCVGSDVAIWHDCQGSARYPDGVYVGEFRNGLQNGRGTFTSSNKVKYFGEYVGEFKNGLQNGRGTFTTPKGNIFVGEFKNAKYNGPVSGTKTEPSGTRYVGEFNDWHFNGQGVLTFADGRKLVGEFKDNQITSGGTQSFPDGRKYVGEFKNNNAYGQGTLIFPDRSKYVGEFKDGERDGKGILYAANGSIISSGIWADDEYVGTVASQELVAMEREGGVYVVPVRFNGAITLNAIIDSGAADVSIPSDVISTLVRTKTISEQEFLGVQTYVLADGSKVPSPRFRIRSLKVGNKTIENVTASIASGKADILLGQSFLSRFKYWSIDNERHVLTLRLP